MTIYLSLLLVTLIFSYGYCGIGKLKVDANILSLGGAFAGDPNTSLYLNPASTLKAKNISYTCSLLPSHEYNFSLVTATLEHFGVTILIDTLTSSTEQNYDGKMTILSFGIPVGEGAGVGINLKEHLSSYGELQNKLFVFDVGFLKEWGTFSLGVIGMNLGANTEKSGNIAKPFPAQTRLGLSYKPNKFIKINFDINDNKEIYLGYQQRVVNGVVARLGLEAGDLTLGLGLRGKNTFCDFAYMANDLWNSQRITIGLEF